MREVQGYDWWAPVRDRINRPPYLAVEFDTQFMSHLRNNTRSRQICLWSRRVKTTASSLTLSFRHWLVACRFWLFHLNFIATVHPDWERAIKTAPMWLRSFPMSAGLHRRTRWGQDDELWSNSWYFYFWHWIMSDAVALWNKIETICVQWLDNSYFLCWL